MRLRPHSLALALALSGGLQAGERIYAASGDANPLQYLGAGARPASLGSAFTAVGGDLSSLYFNPAGLGTLRGSHAGLHHHNWLGGITQESLSFGVGGSAASFGLTGDLVNYGEFAGTDEYGNPLPSFTPVDLTLGVNLGRSFESGLSIGMRARGTQQNIKDAGQLSTAGDVGAIWTMKDTPFSLGITYANFGPSVNGSAPSAAIRLGLSTRLDLGQEYGLLFLLSGSGLNNGGQLIQTGAELAMTRYLAARVGYQAAFMDQGYDGFSGLSAGLGIKFSVFTLDYAYLPYGRIGSSHRVSVNIDFFSGSEPSAMPPKRPQAQPSAPAAARAAAGPAGPAVDLVFELPSASHPDDGPSEADLKKAVKANPLNAQAWHALGNYYYRAKNRPAMLEAFDKLMELQPNNQELKNWLKKVRGME